MKQKLLATNKNSFSIEKGIRVIQNRSIYPSQLKRSFNEFDKDVTTIAQENNLKKNLFENGYGGNRKELKKI